MSTDDFVECWVAACRHAFVKFSREQYGSHSFRHVWNACVGPLQLSLQASPYIEGRHKLSEATLWPYINSSMCCDDPLTAEQAKRCIEVWTVRQCLERPIDKERVLDILKNGQ